MEQLETCLGQRSYIRFTGAWDDALTFKRASRSLAKTGFLGPPKMKKNHGVFEVFRRLRGKLGFLTSKNHSVFEVSGGWMVKNPSVFEVFT